MQENASQSVFLGQLHFYKHLSLDLPYVQTSEDEQTVEKTEVIALKDLFLVHSNADSQHVYILSKDGLYQAPKPKDLKFEIKDKWISLENLLIPVIDGISQLQLAKYNRHTVHGDYAALKGDKGSIITIKDGSLVGVLKLFVSDSFSVGRNIFISNKDGLVEFDKKTEISRTIYSHPEASYYFHKQIESEIIALAEYQKEQEETYKTKWLKRNKKRTVIKTVKEHFRFALDKEGNAQTGVAHAGFTYLSNKITAAGNYLVETERTYKYSPNEKTIFPEGKNQFPMARGTAMIFYTQELKSLGRHIIPGFKSLHSKNYNININIEYVSKNTFSQFRLDQGMLSFNPELLDLTFVENGPSKKLYNSQEVERKGFDAQSVEYKQDGQVKTLFYRK